MTLLDGRSNVAWVSLGRRAGSHIGTRSLRSLALGAAIVGTIAMGCGSSGGNPQETPDAAPPGKDAGAIDASTPTHDAATTDGATTDGATNDGAVPPPPPPVPLTQYVDTTIGTGLALTTPGAIAGGQGGSVFPGADAPFGMVQWSPDTPNGQPSGYVYADTAITGFSLTHFSGAGCPNNGDLPILPVVSASQTQVGFAHADEKGTAGYYTVKTSDGVFVELTATQRAGVGRFTFPAGGGSLIVDATRNGAFTPIGSITTAGTSFDGVTETGHFCGSSNYTNLYFHAELDQPFTATPTSGGKVTLTFAPGAGPVTLKVGISYVSGTNAKLNLSTEVGSKGFDDVHTAATAAWNARLNAIQVDGASDTEKTKFYTALYHALLHPNVFSDVNGEYLGFDKTTHTAAGRVQYANYSGWDIYRSEIQLLAFLFPDVASDMLESLVDDAKTCGYFVMWAQNNADDTVMAGDPGALIVANGYAFGATGFDTKSALAVLTHPPTSNFTCSDPEVLGSGSPYVALGYLTDAYFGGGGATSTTLELTNRDYAVAMFARALGDESHARAYLGRAGTWRYLYTPYSSGSGAAGPVQLEGRGDDGSWNKPMMAPADKMDTIEGSSEQYLWDVPYAVPDLVTLLGGKSAFVARLDTFFTKLNEGQTSANFYMGNEPGFETPWEYNWAGAASHTQALMNRLVETTFDISAAGLPGNDNLGAMSSWLVWAMLGMYPEVPGVGGFALSQPTFANALIYSSNGRTIHITASNTPGPYIQSATLGGAPLDTPWLALPAAATKTEIAYTLGTSASSWGSTPPPNPYPSTVSDLPSAANNLGILDESNPGDVDMDGWGYALSAQALAAGGFAAGSQVTVDGLTFAWPKPGVDNVVPVGQTITFATPVTASRIGILGTSVSGGATASLTVTTTAGKTMTLPFALDDWTLAAGSAKVTAPNQIAATMAYRVNPAAGSKDNTKTYVFYVPIALGASTQIASITLPGQFPGSGTMHLFAIATH